MRRHAIGGLFECNVAMNQKATLVVTSSHARRDLLRASAGAEYQNASLQVVLVEDAERDPPEHRNRYECRRRRNRQRASPERHIGEKIEDNSRTHARDQKNRHRGPQHHSDVTFADVGAVDTHGNHRDQYDDRIGDRSEDVRGTPEDVVLDPDPETDKDAGDDQQGFATRDNQVRRVDVVPQNADMWHRFRPWGGVQDLLRSSGPLS